MEPNNQIRRTKLGQRKSDSFEVGDGVEIDLICPSLRRTPSEDRRGSDERLPTDGFTSTRSLRGMGALSFESKGENDCG